MSYDKNHNHIINNIPKTRIPLTEDVVEQEMRVVGSALVKMSDIKIIFFSKVFHIKGFCNNFYLPLYFLFIFEIGIII